MNLLLFLIFSVIATTCSAEDSAFMNGFNTESNRFTADLYRELSKAHSGNFLVCPISVEGTMALVMSGAGGAIAKEHDTGLHFFNDKDMIKSRMQDDKYTVTAANKIYVKDGYKVLDEFKRTAVDPFESNIEMVNFKKNAEAAATMNTWVEKQTNGKIQDLINKDDLNGDTRAVIISVMYFRGQWIRGFLANATIPHAFSSPNGKQIEVQMMQQLNELNYAECSITEAKYVEIPYEGDEITMTIVLPKETNGLSALEAKLDKVLGEHNYTKQSIELKLPKFEIKSVNKFNPFSQPLSARTAFMDDADVKAIHIASIEVEEKGTVLSAATAAIEPIERSAGYKRPQVFRFVADHPFIFYMKNKNFVVFVGRYTGV